MVHFTTAEAAKSIARQGFLNGSALTAILGHTSGKHHATPGVNFAFLLDDDYSIMSLSGFDFGIQVEAAVVFQADAVRMMHATDGFYQAAFWGPDARGPFHVIQALDRPAFLEPHEGHWVHSTGAAGLLFELLDEVIHLQPA